MLPSATTSIVQPTAEAEYLTPRRIRHITGVQIRNLTPFPVRDSFTSALTQPAEQSHFTVSGITDDFGSILSRKRARKISSHSTATRRSLKWEDGVLEKDTVSPVETRGRTASTSTITFSNSGNISTSPSNALSSSSSRSTHSLRGRRPRTSSMTSFGSNHLGPALPPSGPPTAFSTSSFLPDNSQNALQKVIGSRLVETFIIVNVPSSIHAEAESSQGLVKPLRSAPIPKFSSWKSRPQKFPSSSLGIGTDSLPSKTLYKNQNSHPDSAPPSKTSFNLSGIKHNTRSNLPSTTRLNGVLRASNLPSQRNDKMVGSPLQETEPLPGNELDSPVYFSPIHRPSTNPFFPIDARSGRDFPQWSTSGQSLKIEVWSRTPVPEKKEGSGLPENRQHLAEQSTDGECQEWKMLDEWEFSLDKLVPLPDDVDINPSSLPSNTIVVTLSPPGQVLYLPTSSVPLSGSSTPSAGYASDPESEIRKAKQINKLTDSGKIHYEILPLSRRRRRKHLDSTAGSREAAKTAGWQELFKLVTVQSLILDNETSLGEVVRKTDSLLEEDEAFPLRRQISEREARIKELRQNHDIVLEQCARRKQEIMERSQRLQLRTQLLASASNALESHLESHKTIEQERKELTILQEKMNSIRTSLLSTLSTIFPIELYSPPDLLFTVLDVPLPIPLTPNDPAPPLALAEHKEVTEEAVAAALGYVAQVLQILAAYIGKNLVYPVTCIGSRSLIRDGISAMVGPRMFPLFSKGVDTYRFEYGVFLLNKDIEMLMSERDLRALDIRHTLPNLKNLMLTLSHDSVPKSQPIVRTHSPISIDSGLNTPSRESSPVRDDLSTPKASQILGPNGADAVTPTASGTTTPTTAAMLDESRKPKSFLGFVPFTDFLRARYPSTTSQASDKRAAKALAPTDPHQEDESEDVAENADLDDDDRTTIHGVASDLRDGLSDGESIGQGTPLDP